MKNIFISSTFRDMQEERDLVQERVLPALRAEACKYGENVGVIDLRWGVDTSTLETDAGSAKVLSVCLSEIERSHPYMLIFLGERYGWIPEGKLIEKAISGRTDRYTADDLEKSVTALEIEYGALSEKYGELSNCVVCLREPVAHLVGAEDRAIYMEQNPKGVEKLCALKERIQRELGTEGHLFTYSCKWDEATHGLVDFCVGNQPLEEVLIKCYTEMFRKDWEAYELLSWQEKEQLAFHTLMEIKIRSFVGRKDLLQYYYQKVVNGTEALILQGEVGSGKTAIMCKLYEKLRAEKKHAFAFFAGAGNSSTSADSLVKQMVYYLETVLGLKEHFEEEADTQEWIGYFKGLCYRLPKEEKVYFFIDALDQLFQDEHVEKLDFLVTGRNIQMVLSCTDNFPLPTAILIKHAVEKVPTLNKMDAKQVTEGIFAYYSRNTYEVIEQEILKKESIRNPLYISLLVQRLNMMDAEELYYAKTEEEIVALGIEIIRSMPKDLETAIVSIIENAIVKVSDNEEMLRESINYLAVSRSGLRIQDFQKMFGMKGTMFPVLDFSVLLKYLNSFFYIQADDRNDFTHKAIRQGLLKNIKERKIYESTIRDYLCVLDAEDALRTQEGMYYARILEDYEFAKQLLLQACKSGQEDLVKAIKREAVADGGVFYSNLIENELQIESDVKQFFHYCLIEKFGLSKKEMKARIAIAKALVQSNEVWHKKCGNKESLRELSSSYNSIGCALLDAGKADEALGYCEKALACDETLHKSDVSEVSLRMLTNSYCNMGHASFSLGRKDDALEYNRKALKCAEELYAGNGCEDNLKELSLSYDHVGHALRAVGQSEEALRYYKSAQKYAEELCAITKNEENIRVLSISYNGAGNAYKDLGRAGEALSCYEKALECREELAARLGSEASLNDVWSMYYNIGCALCDLGRNQEAFTYYDKMLRYAEELHVKIESEASLRDLLISYESMKKLLTDMGRTVEAEKISARLIELSKK